MNSIESYTPSLAYADKLIIDWDMSPFDGEEPSVLKIWNETSLSIILDTERQFREGCDKDFRYRTITLIGVTTFLSQVGSLLGIFPPIAPMPVFFLGGAFCALVEGNKFNNETRRYTLITTRLKHVRSLISLVKDSPGHGKSFRLDYIRSLYEEAKKHLKAEKQKIDNARKARAQERSTDSPTFDQVLTRLY